MKNNLIAVLSFFAFAGTAYALPYYQQTAGLVPGLTDTYYVGTSTIEYQGIYTKNLVISGTCTGCSSSTIGTGTTGQFPYYAAGGTALTATSSLFLSTSGNVGIGTSTPSYLLDVAGYINTDAYSGYKQGGTTTFYSTTTSNSLYIGQSAGAGFLATASGVSTSGNIAIGFQALNSATSSTQNTAIGYQAELGNTVSGSGIAIQNTAVGYQALHGITIGAANVAIGDAALFSDTSGSQNTAFGHQTLQANTTGIRNMGIGYQALNANIGGGRNTAVGYQAGAGSTASDNTFIGYSSGQSLTAGSGNIFIGQGVDAPVVTGNQQLNIGNVIYGTNIYDVSNVLSSTPVNGKVGIGTTTPYAYLSVQVGGDYGSRAASTVFAIGSSTAGAATTTLFSIDSNGHKTTGGASPTCGAGCASVTGDDQTFRAITGTGVTAVTVNFSQTYTNTPVCISSDESGGTTVSDASSSPSSVTMNLSASLTTKSIGVICQISRNFTF
jgi:hypothetical protein